MMPLPKKWQRFFIGRKVNHPNKSDLEGVVKYAASTRLGKKSSEGTVPGEAITMPFCVEWADGTSQVMEGKDLAAIATDEFVKEDWVLDRILKLQEYGWNEAKADAAMTKPSDANVSKAKSKGQSAMSKSAGAGPSKPGGSKAGPGNTTNAVSLSLQELKRQASSPGAAPPNAKKARKTTLPLSSSQEANKQKPQSGGGAAGGRSAAALKKLKTKKKAADDSSTNGEDTDGNPATTSTKPTAKNITFPSPPRAGAAGGGRVLSSMLHVSALAFAKVRGKIVYQYYEVTVDGSKYRVYTKDIVIASNVCFRAVGSNGKPADMTIDTWKVREKYEKSEEYFVDCIAAERLTKESKKLHSSSSSSTAIEYNPAHYEYLLKYTRFELDPGPESWLSYEEVEQTAVYDKWEKTGRKAFEKGMVTVKTAAGLEF